MNWPITPEGMYYAVKFLNERYQRPILITENGMANTDFVMLDGKVHDPQRIDYVHRYLLALNKAIEEGIEIAEPVPEEHYSGQFKLRIPKSLHKQLSEQSSKEGISMNQYCLYLLAQNNAKHIIQNTH